MSGPGSPLLLFLARMHVVLVHFPIALIVAAGLIEFVRLRASPQPGRSSAASLCLALGAIGAVAAAASGWQLAELEPPGRSLERTLFLHRWTGVATAGLALVTLGIGYLQAASVSVVMFRVYRVALVLCVLFVSAAGHFGGEMVHGEDYLLGVFGGTGEMSGGAPPGVDDVAVHRADEEPAAGASRVDYAMQVEPLLAARCYECHGPAKTRGKLRLDEMSTVFDPSREERWVIRPGDPGASELLHRVGLPADDEDIMPAKGDPLTSEQIAMLRRWIEQGARWEAETPR